MRAALWWLLFRVLSAALAKVSDEVTLHAPASTRGHLSPNWGPAPEPIQLGPRARHAARELTYVAYTDPVRAVAAQGGLFLGRMGGNA